MAHDVFISYSSKDKKVADAVCAALESVKIRCWVAPRDVLAGEKWPEAISDAIEKSPIMVLIFSSNSNNSKDVSKELVLAMNVGVTVIPLRIEDIQPKGVMKYYLSDTHWIDALNPPTKKQIESIVETVSLLVYKEKVDSGKQNVYKKEDDILPPEREKRVSGKKVKLSKSSRLLIIIGSILFVAIIATVFIVIGINSKINETNVAVSETTTAETTITETTAPETTAPETTAPETTAKDKIVFASYFREEDGNVEIYIMNIDGSEQVNLTNNSANDDYPSFSPDGSKIAFTSDRDGNLEIYTMNVDGSDQVRLTNNPANDEWPCFSSDGAKITFNSNRDGNPEIYTMNVDGSGQINLTNNLEWDEEPSFSPDGSKIAFGSTRDGNLEIYIMNVDGSGQVNLTNNLAKDGGPSFSPDGSKIAFNSDRDGNWEIYIMNIDGSEQVRLTNNQTDANNPASANDWVPSFSPDGSKIAFLSGRDKNDEIYIMNIDGSEQIRLTNNPANDRNPSFSP